MIQCTQVKRDTNQKSLINKEIIAMEKTQDIENKLDIAYEILCLVAVKFNKSFPSNYHEKLADKYSFEKVDKAYQMLQAV